MENNINMENNIIKINDLHKKLFDLIKKQKQIKYFVEWEYWLDNDFNPLYDEYKKLCSDVPQGQYIFVDFKQKVDIMIYNDCHMIYD